MFMRPCILCAQRRTFKRVKVPNQPGSVKDTASLGYFEKYAMPEIKTNIAIRSKYIPLSDYYMYLWFHNNIEEKDRANKKLVFIEYYKDQLPVTAYFVDASRKEYKKKFLMYMPHTGSISNMISTIMGCKCFAGVTREKVLMFQTFKSDEENLYKLKKEQGVKMVESTWEDILRGVMTLKIKELFYAVKPPCPKCPYTLGLVHTLVNPCPDCKANGYQTYERFPRKFSENIEGFDKTED